MIIQSQSELEMFLYIFGPPYKTFCKCLSLNSGVFLIAIIDIIIGIFDTIFGLWLLSNIVFYFASAKPLTYFLVISALINIIGLPFAIIGISGITRRSEKDLKLYYQFKIVELFAEGFINIIEAEVEFYHKHGHFLHLHDELIYSLIIVFIIIIISGFSAKVVWSAFIRLKYDELESSVELSHS